MLGFLFRIAHSLAPNALAALFPRQIERSFPTRGARHGLQFQDFVQQGGHTEVFRRSCFGLATIWNMLPMDIARAKSVKDCQKRIQLACLTWAQSNPDKDWAHFLLKDARRMLLYQFQSLFR